MPGVNNFTINATDKAGNSSSVTVSVNYVNQKNKCDLITGVPGIVLGVGYYI